MGDHEGLLPNGLLPNGLLPNAAPLLENLDSVRWLKAEERTAELIACIQPNQPSEERRNSVADYVQRLIMKCFPCQVFTFGSVPLKTYLPDGDIDLTAFSNNPTLKDSWASEVRDMLEFEENNENAEFRVKEVQYIQAEVKIIKCLVENIVVDISFNQLGGLCTLCFLEEVDNLINHSHLFKRSIILIKAWCYYESRILGAHHGLISTYALETLVLYIFHVFNNSFSGPLEVLYRFLEFFSNFDWELYCVSLWGPVPISSLPDVTAEPPRKDSGELLLKKAFLDACSSVYAVFPGTPDNQGQTFVSKHFNVIDPLRVSNNLGRSVSKGNFFRIRSAFAFGAKRLARLLDCPQENVVAEVNEFFTNTWARHGSGVRPDAPNAPGPDSLFFNLSIDTRPVNDIPKINDNTSHQHAMSAKVNRGKKNLVSGQLVNDISKSPFARTRSSPELTDSGRNQPPNRRKNVEPELPNHTQTHQRVDVTVDSNNGSQGMNQEEQDHVNMVASSGLYGFNGQLHMPMGHLPFPFPQSFLAGMGYAQKNVPGMIPSNFALIDPAFPGMQFPQLTRYFSGLGVASDEDSVEPGNQNLPDDSWGKQEQDLRFEPERMSVNSETITPDDNIRASSAGLSYVPPPRRVDGSGGLIRSQSQHKYKKEKRGPFLDSDEVSDERTVSSRFSSAARSISLKSKTSSESSWDETSTVNKSTKEKRGKKPAVVSAESSSGYFKGKTMFESTPAQQYEDDDQESVRAPSVSSDTSHGQGPGPGPGLMHVLRSHLPGYEPAQTSGSEPMVPVGPMILGPNSRQRMMDNSGNTPLKFYPTGPPVPFFTMLSFHNVPAQPAPSDPPSSHFGADNNVDTDVEDFGPDSLRRPIPGEIPDGPKPDILNSDFDSHWQNLQYARYCQSPHQHGPTPYPSPLMVPPVYLQARVPWDGPGRPVQNMNLATQFMNYGPHLVPVPTPAPVPNRPPSVYPRYVEDLPRYRSGTGTYLPHLVPAKDRSSSGPRRGNYNHYRSDSNHIDKGNWNGNSKSRGSGSGSGRNHNRNHLDKSSFQSDRFDGNESRADRSPGSYRHPFSTYQTQNGSSGQANVTYGAYPKVYPYEHGTGFASNTQALEFGSLGATGYSGVNEQARLNDGPSRRGRGAFEEHRSYGGSVQRSSPDRPLSPRQRR